MNDQTLTFSPRNTSLNTYFRERAEAHVPEFRFAGKSKADWKKWRSGLLPRAIASLGKMPARVPLNAQIEAEWSEDGLIKQRVIFDVDKNLSLVGYVFRPESAKGKLPAILACHGHGGYGKDSVMGNRANPEVRIEIDALNYAYGLAMAKAGFAVMSIDWRGFNERDDRMKPHRQDIISRRDICDVLNLFSLVFGHTALGLNVHDGKCALDYLSKQDFVDAENIGTMGLSFGGTMAMWMSVCDERIKAANIICYSDRFAAFGLRDANFCGSQVAPGVFELADVPDLQGLIAPRPLLVEIGLHDKCFLVDSAMSCYHEVQKIYAAAGASDRLELDLFPGGHAWGGNKSVAFFRKYLA